MSTIQILIVVALAFLVVLYFVNFKNRLFVRIFFLLLFFVGIVFAFSPNITNNLAKFFGVGRGADLMMYLFILFSFFAFVFIYAKFRKIQRQLTEIIRKDAIDSSVVMDSEKATDN